MARHLRRWGPVAALVLVLTACTDVDPGTDPTTSASPTGGATATAGPTGEPTTEPGAEPTTEPATEPAGTEEVPVYFVVDTRNGIRLARELREVVGDPLVGAVETMVAGPQDPDYTTTWDPATEVLGVEDDDGTLVADLSTEARTANVGSEGAAMMVQQLVHTVTGAAGAEDADVLLLIDGEPAGELWGTLVWDEPVAAEDPLDVRQLVQIDRPAEGAAVTSPLTVSGEAAVFEANLPWRVLDDAGTEVEAGFTMTSEGQTFAPFSFTVELDPGTYTVEITEDDPSGGAGGEPTVDTRTVTVG